MPSQATGLQMQLFPSITEKNLKEVENEVVLFGGLGCRPGTSHPHDSNSLPKKTVLGLAFARPRFTSFPWRQAEEVNET